MRRTEMLRVFIWSSSLCPMWERGPRSRMKRAGDPDREWNSQYLHLQVVTVLTACDAGGTRCPICSCRVFLPLTTTKVSQVKTLSNIPWDLWFLCHMFAYALFCNSMLVLFVDWLFIGLPTCFAEGPGFKLWVGSPRIFKIDFH